MPNYRHSRINEEMAKEVALLLRDVKDPRVSKAFVSVTAVEVTPDLKLAKVYYSILQGDAKDVKQGLISATGFLRRQIAERLNLRITPELSFIPDDSMAYGANISKLLRQVELEGKKTDE